MLTLVCLAAGPLLVGVMPSVPHPFVHSLVWWVPIPERVDAPAPGEGDGERVLVIAPHPDDDVLGVGGSIAEFTRQGHEVCVVFVTNGDANEAAQLLLTLNPLHRAADYKALGYRRQKEAARALDILGVPSSHMLFLGYPDGGLTPLWSDHWSPDNPFTSPRTRVDRSPYRNTYSPDAVYAGADLLADLVEIIDIFRPTIVYMPHPEDRHPDHQASYHFGMKALSLASSVDEPEVRLYVVHVPDWPAPHRLLPDLPLAIPPVGSQEEWETVELCQETVDLKMAAVRAHMSQRWTNGRFLARFVRATEVYARPSGEGSPTSLDPAMVWQAPRGAALP